VVLIAMGTSRFVAVAPTFHRTCRRQHWSSTASIGERETHSIWERSSSTWA
jgi:hypothetical protein